ncbi:MAG: hypothetical protein U0T84_09005 [Chitinophagales bacterium]
MKKIFLSLMFAAGLTGSLWAQGELEEVVYVKNGNIYRGTIIEQVPNQDIKIKTIGGNVFTVAMGDILKISKEEKLMPPPPPPGQMPPPMPGQGSHGCMDAGKPGCMHMDQPGGQSKPFYYKRRGYFLQVQIAPEIGQMGFRVINGYRAGRFAQFGIGVGLDGVYYAVNESFGGRFLNRNGIQSRYQGLYAPIFLSYTGDILKRRVTPFYNFELGYAFSLNRSGGQFLPFSYYDDLTVARNYGGIMGGFGLGVKIQTAHRFNVRLSLNWDFKTNRFRNDEYYYDDMGNRVFSGTTRGTDFLAFPGLKVAFGF